MLILGINAFHPDSSVCALRDGKLVAALAEERIGKRTKHVSGFPAGALRAVLKMAGADIRDVEYIALGNDRNANLRAKIAHVCRTPIRSARGVVTHFQHRAKARSFASLVADACGAAEADCRFKVVCVEHHLAHIASSYYASDFDQAAGFSYDAAGDFVSAMYARCEGNRIEVLDRVFMPDSLGYFYTALCQLIGFDRFGEEYKVMGLAAYGEPKYMGEMGELLRTTEPGAGSREQGAGSAEQGAGRAEGRGRRTDYGPRDQGTKGPGDQGTSDLRPPTSYLRPPSSVLRPPTSVFRSLRLGQFRLDGRYFRALQKNVEECVNENGEIIWPPLYSEKLIKRFGPARTHGAELTQRDRDVAASCQGHFEEVVLRCLEELHRRVPTENLVTAGGCALNGVCNARILRDTPFRRSYIQCAASDDGTAIGAALYVWNAILGKQRAGSVDHAYWGPEYSEAEMEKALRDANVLYERLERDRLLSATVDRLTAGQVIGWYQGRSEWGPRALGNRSILAHPGWPGMKDLINEKIKRREPFRPFAPTILAEEVCHYFEQTLESPFMMHVVKIKPDKRAKIPAVCHADNTGRLHTVKRSQNPLYYDLIKTFAARTGIPVLLNTSFNENEPIVDTPAQAVSCFVRTDIDVLVIGPFVADKRKELKS